MPNPRNKKAHGKIRLSQVVSTFGPGALVDLPERSIIVAGLDHWSRGRLVVEPRLVEKLKALLEVNKLELYNPPPAVKEDGEIGERPHIRGFQFPEWFVTQDSEAEERHRGWRGRRLVHRKELTRGKYIDDHMKRRPVVPVRFIRACRHGHIGDIDWRSFVHRAKQGCSRPLWIEERGTSGDITEIWVRCECREERPLNDATVVKARPLGVCDGARPWLGPRAGEGCGEPSRLLIRSASNAYFPQLMSVISLPDRDDDLKKRIQGLWDFLGASESADDITHERKKPKVKGVLEPFTDEEVFAALREMKGEGGGGGGKTVKQAEIETLRSCATKIGEDKPDSDFHAVAMPKEKWSFPWMTGVDQVVLVPRLREVRAIAGFTRFEASAANVEGELEMGVTRAPLQREVQWLPAVENRGEGIFIGFDGKALASWSVRPEVAERGRQLVKGFDTWCQDHPSVKRKFPGLPYVMLHSLSHLLITAISLECGYPSTSIRERVYVGDSGNGIMLYTGTPDAEGTLGGLIEAGRRIAHHVKAALELGRLCSNDPVCAQHSASDALEGRHLLGAACHGCLLISETCCEQFNAFLDRALVVSTLEANGAEFFGEV